MRAIVQRVSRAEVRVGGDVVGSCGKGLALLVGVHRNDDAESARKLADRVWGLRIFSDAEGKMNLALKDFPMGEAEALAVSNFTVYGETAKNRRPSFIESAPYEVGRSGFEAFVSQLRNLGCKVSVGEFGADMQVELVNDGPVTVIVDVE